MVAVQRLPRGVEAGGVVRALPDRVELAGSGDDRSADSEAALLLNNERMDGTALRGNVACRAKRS